MIEIALVGNPNCGKTTLFNALTKERQRVGNWTGVTNEIKRSKYFRDDKITIVDLPGVYSLDEGAEDSKCALSYLNSKNPTVIINLIDGTNLERNLYLTCNLIRLQKPIVLAVNMCDMIKKKGLKIDIEKLSKTLGVPVVEISAVKEYNLDRLIKIAKENRTIPKKIELEKYGKNSVQENVYAFINDKLKVVVKGHKRVDFLSNKIDDILMHNLWGIPIFALVMIAVYYLSINLGGVFGGGISKSFDLFGDFVKGAFNSWGVSGWIISLTCDAVISAIGGILSFLPQVLILFALLALIEDSGYAARVVFLFDRFFRSFGLGGKSLMPMIVSCGCTVTGLMSTRIIEGEKERVMTIFLSPFMPCGAKTAVFAYFASELFGGNALIAASTYFLGMICVGVFGSLLKRFKFFKNSNDCFIMEIPDFRAPSLNNVLNVMLEKVKEFLLKAGLTVFCVSVFLWLLKSVGLKGFVGDNIENSFLFMIGNAIKWVFYPLGFSSWQASVSIISGTFAKEAIVESLELLSADTSSIFLTKYSAYAFMAFVLLSPPCVASLATAYRELGSKKLFLAMCVFQFLAAYTVALIINLTGYLICSFGNLILSAIIVIIITISLILAIKRLAKSGCSCCENGCRGENKCRKKEKRFTT